MNSKETRSDFWQTDNSCFQSYPLKMGKITHIYFILYILMQLFMMFNLAFILIYSYLLSRDFVWMTGFP